MKEKERTKWLEKIKKEEERLEREFHGDWKGYDELVEGSSDMLRRIVRDLLSVGEDDKTLVFPNYAYPIVATFLSLLTQSTPVIQVKSNRVGYFPQEAIVRRVWTHYLRARWSEREVMGAIKSATRDALVYGIGWLKVGYGEGTTGYRIKISKRGNLYLAPEERGEGYLSPWCIRLPPQNMIYERDGFNLLEKDWVAQKIVKTYSELSGDPRYEIQNLNLKQTTKEAEEKDGERIVTIYEVWDKVGKRMFIISPDVDRVLYEGDNPFMDVGGYPYVTLVVNPIQNRFEGKSILSVVKYQLAQICALSTILLNIAKSSVPKIFCVKPSLSEEQVKSLQSAVPNYVVCGISPNEVQTFAPQGVPLPIMDILRRIYEDIEIQLGFTRSMQGLPMGGRTTATEAEEVATHSRVRLAPGLACVEDACVKVATLMVECARLWGENEEVTFYDVVQDETGNFVPKSIRRPISELPWEGMYVSILGGSTYALFEEQKKRELAMLIPSLMQIQGANIPFLLSTLLTGFGWELEEVVEAFPGIMWSGLMPSGISGVPAQGAGATTAEGAPHRGVTPHREEASTEEEE